MRQAIPRSHKVYRAIQSPQGPSTPKHQRLPRPFATMARKPGWAISKPPCTTIRLVNQRYLRCKTDPVRSWSWTVGGNCFWPMKLKASKRWLCGMAHFQLLGSNRGASTTWPSTGAAHLFLPLTAQAKFTGKPIIFIRCYRRSSMEMAGGKSQHAALAIGSSPTGQGSIWGSRGAFLPTNNSPRGTLA